jgi:hypothetical protein
MPDQTASTAWAAGPAEPWMDRPTIVAPVA